MRMRRWGNVALAGMILAVGALSSCGDGTSVKVISVEELNSGYEDILLDFSGFTTDEAAQNIYLKEKQKIKEICVKPGDHVTVGQVLAEYDMDSIRLQLEEEELKNQSLQLQIQKCKQDMEQLNQGKIPPQTIIKKETSSVKGAKNGEEEKEILHEILDDGSQPMKGDGTKKSPYVFLVKNTCAVMGSFFNKMEERPYWFRLEVREGDQMEGKLIQAWNGDGSLLKRWHPDSRIILENLDAVTELKDALKPEEIIEETEAEESSIEETEAEESSQVETDSEFIDGIGEWSPDFKGGWNDTWREEGDQGGESIKDSEALEKELATRKEETRKELKNLELQLRQSELNKKSLENTLEDSSITSAVDGVVENVVNPNDGSFSALEPIIKVVSQNGLYVIGECKEIMMQSLKKGDTVEGFSYGSGGSFEVEVVEISQFPSKEEHMEEDNTSYYPFIGYIKDTENIIKGEYIKLTIPMGESDEGGIYLGQAFIRRVEGKNYVMKRGADGRLVRQEVSLGKIVNGENYEIISGLETSDYIAFPYGKNVKEGQKQKSSQQMNFGRKQMVENIRLSFQGIWSHKMRSFLTMLGIIIGIASIIAIVSTIKGTNELIKQNLVGAGDNSIYIRLYQGDSEYYLEQGTPYGILPLTSQQKDAVRNLKQVKSATFYRNRSNVSVYANQTSFDANILGIDQEYMKTCGYRLVKGRNFVSQDGENFHKAAILDLAAAQSLFGEAEPLGKTVEIMGEPFVIVGVVEKEVENQMVIQSMKDYMTYHQNETFGNIFIPSETWPVLVGFDEAENAVIRAFRIEEMTEAGNKTSELMNGCIQKDQGENGFYFKADDLLKKAKDLQEVSENTNQQLIWIASISLLVGGIGVMNIMLVSVTERTREIGLKKAIGARRGRILIQFLTEAAVLTSLGGIVGVFAGIVASQIISKVSQTPVAVSVPAILAAVLFSMGIGILFGLLPSVKAAKLNPIDALRYE